MRLSAFLAVLAVAPLAAAQNAPTPGTAAAPVTPAPHAAPDAHGHAPTPLAAAVARGATAFHNRDYDGAQRAFREAAGIDAQSPLPQLYTGSVQAARNDAAGALGALRDAQRLATVAGDDTQRARAMAGLAMVQEAQGHWDDARLAWQDYTTFVAAHATAGFPATGRARVEAIQRRATLDQQYAPVRQRIAERLRLNAAGGENASPPPEAPQMGSAPARPLRPARPRH